MRSGRVITALFVCRQGFGAASGEHWLGNDFANRLTAQQSYKLRIALSDWEGNSGFSQYEQFSLDSEAKNYRYVVLETLEEYAHLTFFYDDSTDSAFFFFFASGQITQHTESCNRKKQQQNCASSD